jgi:hypothetical protein
LNYDWRYEFIEPFFINPGNGSVYGRSYFGKYNQKTPTINKPIARIYQERFDKLMMQHGLAEGVGIKIHTFIVIILYNLLFSTVFYGISFIDKVSLKWNPKNMKNKYDTIQLLWWKCKTQLTNFNVSLVT